VGMDWGVVMVEFILICIGPCAAKGNVSRCPATPKYLKIITKFVI
jgi:hypothetical protein